MKERVSEHFFVIVKAIGLLIMTCWSVTFFIDSMEMTSIYFLLTSVFFAASMITETLETKWSVYIVVGIEGVLGIVSVFLFPVHGMILIAIGILDLVSTKKLKVMYYLMAYIPVFLLFVIDKANFNYLSVLLTTMIIIFYIQEKVLIHEYKQEIKYITSVESKLKGDISVSEKIHKDELKKSSLKYENMMLEERSQVSQALHDKLGHSINGSIYKLEAAKVLIDEKKEDSISYIQDVIDSLRSSMDEIRAILRHERPDKKQMALLQIHSLCEECREKYGIHVEFVLEDNDKNIPETIWEIILDNTYEAVTNAMKYARCKNISIAIIILNEVVRCTISDDGKGCSEVKPGMGIDGMKRRVRNAKGYFDIESINGFTINMLLPIEDNNHSKWGKE